MSRALTNFNFPSYMNDRMIGFDRVASILENFGNVDGGLTEWKYPPHNMVKLGENKFAIEMAVAGFSRDDISVTQNGGKLVVKGQQEKNGEDKAAVTYLHHGISARSFHREFLLADHVFVKGATLENGMLTVTLEVELPEELKPRTIEILDGAADVDQ